LPAAGLLRGQQETQAPPPQQPPAKFSTDVKVVNVFATVRTKSGKIVNNLKQGDFVLDDEGRPQTIKYFSQETDLPLNLGLLVDTSGSQRRVLGDERAASLKFFEQVLREDRDLAFVIHFDYQVELLQDLTNSRAKLEDALNLLQVGQNPNQQQQQGGNYPNGGGYPGGGYPGGGYPGGGYPGGGYPPRRYPGGGGGGGRRGGTTLYDSILLASDDIIKKQQGRKALILLTDGVDNGSKSTIYQAIASAQKADTFVYSILFSDPDAYGGPGMYGPMGRRRMGYPGGGYPGGGGYDRPDGKKILQQISKETGGRFFEVGHFHPIEKIYAEIQEDLRNQYNIGFTPDQANAPGIYRHIQLTTRAKNTVVYAREGYWTT